MTLVLTDHVTENSSQVDFTTEEPEKATVPAIEDALEEFLENRFGEWSGVIDDNPDVKAKRDDFTAVLDRIVMKYPKSERFHTKDEAEVACDEWAAKHGQLTYRAGFLDAMTFMDSGRIKALLKGGLKA